MVLVSSLAKFKQLPNGFGFEFWEIPPIAKQFWYCIVSNTAQRFWSWILWISNNYPSFVWYSWTFVWNSQDSRPKPLGSGFNYAIPKVFGNLFYFWSSFAGISTKCQTPLVLCSWNHCPKVLVLNRRNFKQLSIVCLIFLDICLKFPRFKTKTVGQWFQLRNIKGVWQFILFLV